METSSTGLAHMLANADAVIWLTAIVLLVMSITSWTIIVAKGRSAQKLRQHSAEITREFWKSRSLEEGLAAIRGEEPLGVFAGLAQAAIDSQSAPSDTSMEGKANNEDRITRTLRRALHLATVRLEGGLTALASIGATAPFVGLFGTVWSIYLALANISGAGQLMLEQVAGPVGEALIMTAFGLFVAIPAVLAYNALSKSNRIVVAELDAFANDLRGHLLASMR